MKERMSCVVLEERGVCGPHIRGIIGFKYDVTSFYNIFVFITYELVLYSFHNIHLFMISLAHCITKTKLGQATFDTPTPPTSGKCAGHSTEILSRYL